MARRSIPASMGLFKKKSDPITERARDLNDQIAALQEQIASLAGKLQEAPAADGPPVAETRVVEPRPAPAPAPAQAHHPRLRSTALPRSKGVIVHGAYSAAAAATAPEPVFEEINANPFKVAAAEAEAEPEEEEPDVGVRKGTFGEFWKRITNHFRGPPATNPRLVNYLAAGSIQGLRPLRYEKRVMRNRVIVLIAVLFIVLWGIVSFFLAHR